MAYSNFLTKHVQSNQGILSVASGRCANELYLMSQSNCKITCSDLEYPACIDETAKLFPNLDFVKLDVLVDEPPGMFDAVISLSLIYCFDDKDLDKFFGFAKSALKPRGRLLLDLVGAPDNVWSRAFHDVFLPVETWGWASYNTVRQRRAHVVRRDFHGYRRSLNDVMRIAGQHGYSLRDYFEDGYHLDFMRSPILSMSMARSRIANRALSFIGRAMPYVRMAALATRN